MDPQDGDQVKIASIYPKPEVFSDAKDMTEIIAPESSIRGHGRIFVTEGVVYPDDGGIYRKYRGCLYMEKGLPFEQYVYALNMAKRYMLGLIRLFSSSYLMVTALVSKKTLNTTIRTYCDAANMTLTPFFFMGDYPRYYSDPAKEVKKFLDVFLPAIGVSEENTFNLSRIVMAFIDGDNAYRIRLQDLAGTVTQYDMMHDFKASFAHIVAEHAKRDPHLVFKMEAIYQLVSIAFMVPRIRRGIRKGILAMDWDKLVFSDGDRYFAYWQADYDSDGLSKGDRLGRFAAMHEAAGVGPPMQLEY